MNNSIKIFTPILPILIFIGLILEVISSSLQPAGFSPLMIPLLLIWWILRSLILVAVSRALYLTLNYFKLWGSNKFTLAVLLIGITLFYYGNNQAHSIYFDNNENANLANNYLYYIGYPGNLLILLAISFLKKQQLIKSELNHSTKS